jgi:hypothetical protein
MGAPEPVIYINALSQRETHERGAPVNNPVPEYTPAFRGKVGFSFVSCCRLGR